MSRLISAQIRKKILRLSEPEANAVYLINRNPRNLEHLRIAHKPVGYHLEKQGRSYWHKLELTPSQNYVRAAVKHFQNGPVIEASTSEWALKKQLIKTKDTAAYINLARVLAERCHKSGIIEMYCDIQFEPNSKVEKFLRTLEEDGITLKEGDQFKPHRPWNADRPEKSWEVTE